MVRSRRSPGTSPLMVSSSNHERLRSSFDGLRTSGGGVCRNNCFRGLIVLSLLSAAHAQSRIPDRETVAAIRQLAQSGQAAQAEERLEAFDAASPLVMYLRGLARYHADDHAHAIDLLTAALPRLDAGTLERREAEQVLGLALYAAGRLKE